MTTVLVVDDDPTYRKLLEKKLSSYFADSCKDESGKIKNIEIALAEDGKEAIRFWQKNPVDLLVTDINMPKINGLQLLAYLKKYHPETPCILMTIFSNSEIGENVINDSVLHIQKPFKVEQLAKMILSNLSIDATYKKRSGISLASFLQIIATEGKSCIAKVITSSGESGFFSFKDGELFDAVYADFIGEEAAIKMMAEEGYKIEILDLPKRELKRRIYADSLNSLISQAMSEAKNSRS